jgi:hypothetical protein
MKTVLMALLSSRIFPRFVGLMLALACLFGKATAQESGGPILLSVQPENGATQVDPSVAVTFTFSAPMKRQQSVMWLAGTGVIDETKVIYSWSADGKTLTASMGGGWPANREIQWVLMPSIEPLPPFFPGVTGFEDLQGNTLEGDTEGRFQTRIGGGGTGPRTEVVTNSCGQTFTNVLKSAFTVSRMASYTQAGPDSVVPKAGSGEDGPFGFLAMVMLEAPAVATHGTLRLPSGQTQPLMSFPMSPMLFLTDSATNLNSLTTRFPGGIYGFTLQGASGVPAVVNVSLAEVTIPVIRVLNYVAAQSVDGTKDFVITWAPLGATSKDSVSVEVRDPSGNVLVVSPDSGCPGALDGTSTSFKVPAGVLKPGVSYIGHIQLTLGVTQTEVDATTRSSSFTFTGTEFPMVTTGGGLPPATPTGLGTPKIEGASLLIGCTATVSGRTYGLESSGTPAGPWSGVADKVATGTSLQFEAPVPVVGPQFFRVVDR